MLSAYEQERLANIARNEAFLEQIGLGNDNPKRIPTKTKRDRSTIADDNDAEPLEPTRKSTRVAKLQPEHGQLTDEFCNAEERGLIRPKRERTALSRTFSEIQAEEVTKRQEASLQRAANMKRKLLEQQQQAHIQQNAQKNRLAVVQRPTNIVLPSPQFPIDTKLKPGMRYPVKGDTAVCPLCKGIFVLKKPKYCSVEKKWKPGEFRKHTCVSVHAIMPYD
jgi:hypothetical protein